MKGLQRPFSVLVAENIHWVVLAAVLIAILVSFYRYGIVREYTILLEAPCDPTVSECYARDCADPDACPPDHLSDYQVYALPASFLDRCDSNYCLNLCGGQSAECRAIPCSDQDEIECRGPSHSA
jgi:hypothetical protein